MDSSECWQTPVRGKQRQVSQSRQARAGLVHRTPRQREPSEGPLEGWGVACSAEGPIGPEGWIEGAAGARGHEETTVEMQHTTLGWAASQVSRQDPQGPGQGCWGRCLSAPK